MLLWVLSFSLVACHSVRSQERSRNIIESLKLRLLRVPEYPVEGLPYGYTIRSWQRAQCGDMDTWRRYVLLQRALGYNNVSIDIAWADVEPQPGRYDFSAYDPYLRVIADADLTLQIKLNSRMMPEWAIANRDALLCGPDGQVIEDGFVKAPYHGFADSTMLQALQDFYRAVARNYRDWPNLFYVSAFAVSFESEYHHSIWTDYSRAAQRQFREYLQGRYGSLDELNSAWGSQYGSWEEVGIAWQPPQTMKEDRPDVRYVDFMKYREWAARRFFDALHQAIKQGDPQAEYGPQVGRIVCPVGMRRGTLGAFYWAENCEWIFVDPSPADDFAWELAIARAGGKKVAVELDGPYMFRNLNLESQLPTLYPEHTRLSYEHGAHYVCHANWSETRDYERCLQEGMFERAAAAKQGVYEVPKAADAVYVSKWDCYLFADQPGHALAASKACFQELRAQGRPVDIVLDDTILQNPDALGEYHRIHVRGAHFVARPVWDALQRSGAELVLGDEVQELQDETGSARWSARAP